MIRILVSNIALPTNEIGSWTNRITKLLENNPDFFSFILSPNRHIGPKQVFCKKRKWIPFFPKRWREFEILNYRAASFLKAFLKIYRSHQEIQVIVMDDLLLLEGFALLKKKGFSFKLSYSFHGHSFELPGAWGKNVDQVLFLTKSGYLDTFQRNAEFSPEVSIMGNGVDSNLFFPLSKEEKRKRKEELGFSPDSKLLIWMSNNKPKKGIHLFLSLAKSLLTKYPELEVLVIGAKLEESKSHTRIRSLGRIPNSELPKYLQIGEFYAFTSLWHEGFGLSLAEAAKCGNIVIASKVGGVPDVLTEVPFSILVELPNLLEAWEKAFDEAWKIQSSFNPNPEILTRVHDLQTWERNYLAALQ